MSWLKHTLEKEGHVLRCAAAHALGLAVACCMRRSGEFSLFKLAIAPVFFVRSFKMKYAVFALVLAATDFVFSPASAMMMSCSGADMSKMTTMLAGMPDGPHKWEMNNLA